MKTDYAIDTGDYIQHCMGSGSPDIVRSKFENLCFYKMLEANRVKSG